jgi:hypothetical protein
VLVHMGCRITQRTKRIERVNSLFTFFCCVHALWLVDANNGAVAWMNSIGRLPVMRSCGLWIG